MSKPADICHVTGQGFSLSLYVRNHITQCAAAYSRHEAAPAKPPRHGGDLCLGRADVGVTNRVDRDIVHAPGRCWQGARWAERGTNTVRASSAVISPPGKKDGDRVV